MKEVTRYYCEFCGQSFETEAGCIEHEFEHKLEKVAKHIKFFYLDSKSLIPLSIDADSAEEVNVIFCEEEEAAWDFIDELFGYAGENTVPERIRHAGNYFVYDYENETWYCLDERLHQLTQLAERLDKLTDEEE